MADKTLDDNVRLATAYIGTEKGTIVSEMPRPRPQAFH